MPLIQWTPNYSVGVGEMDTHHRKLFDLLNKLHDAMAEGKASSMIEDIINELIDYTKYHFKEEERLMEKIQYAGLKDQKAAHNKFIAAIEGYKAQADRGLKAFLSSGVSTFLKDWLKNHIGVMDKKYQQDMNAKGIF
jgi:hemerythrin-like metal-binding protein